jgi:N-acetylglucosamine-6-phosphate deacetylase
LTAEMTVRGRLPGSSTSVRVRVRGDVIVGIDEMAGGEEPVDWISPGLIDLQVNGFDGHDVNADPADPTAVGGLTYRLFAEGVTTFVPTIVTASHETVLERLRAIVEARKLDPVVARAIPYAHLEGPHISPEDGPRGVHDADQIRPPSIDEFDDWQSNSGGLIGMVTVSPHYPGSADYIKALVERGVEVAIGHTHADEAQIEGAVEAGARLSTHLGNAAHRMLPRHPNYLWAQLAQDRLTAAFIADGHHLPDSTLTAMIRAKGLGRSILVSDAVVLAGSEPGRYRTSVGGSVELAADGRLSHVDSGLLAGAAVSLRHGVAHAAVAARIGLAGALELATVNPGAFVGGRGALAVGARADLITFGWEPGNSTLALKSVLVTGRQVLPIH